MIGKRVAAAVVRQEDMSRTGVSDVVTDWRARILTRNGFSLYGATTEHADAMHAAGLKVTGTLDELLGQVDVVVDCTPKRIAAKNVEVYRRRGPKFIYAGRCTVGRQASRRSGLPRIRTEFRRCRTCWRRLPIIGSTRPTLRLASLPGVSRQPCRSAPLRCAGAQDGVILYRAMCTSRSPRLVTSDSAPGRAAVGDHIEDVSLRRSWRCLRPA